MNFGRELQNVERTTRVNVFLRASGKLRLLVSWRVKSKHCLIFPAGFHLLQETLQGVMHIEYQWIQSTEYPVDQKFKLIFLVGAEREISAGGKSGRFHDFNGELYLGYYCLNLLIISSILHYTSLKCARD